MAKDERVKERVLNDLLEASVFQLSCKWDGILQVDWAHTQEIEAPQ
jgi:hypothetical protein